MSPLGPDVDGGDYPGPASGWTTGWQRLSQTFLRPPAPGGASQTPHADVSRLADDEKRALITGIDPTERKVGLLAAALAFALAIYANVPYMVSRIAVKTTVKPSHKACPVHFTYATTAGKAVCKTIYPSGHYVLPLVVSLVLALAVYVTVRIRRRAPLAFTIILNGLAFGSLFVLIPFAVGGGWIMLRAWRTQRYGAPTVKAPLPGWVPPPPRGTTRRRATSRGPATARNGKGPARDGKGAPATARKAPTQNKRYTPKAPPKKKVTPPA